MHAAVAPQHVMIVGGGTAGSIVASRLATDLRSELRRGLIRVTLLTERDDHLYQPGLLYVPFGRAGLAALHRPQTALLPAEVQVRTTPVEAVDPGRGEVRVQGGGVVPYDYLVLATGAQPNPAEVPGLEAGGHEFYTEEGATKLRRALEAFDGGRIVLTVGVPHKCPVAPLEFAFLLEEHLRRRGLRERTEIVYTYPLGRVHSLESVAPWAEETLRQRGVQIETFFNLDSVDPEARVAHSMEGQDLDYDLLVAVPPHQGAAFLAASGLAGRGNWVPTDRHTLRVAGQERIYAVGDATDLPISKAGSTAHYQAEVLAANLVDELRGERPGRLYNGKAYCFIEAGEDEATYISFDYDHPPRPVPPSRLLHMFKLAFNRSYWLMPQGIV